MISLSSKRLMETVSSMVDLAKLEANHLSLNVKRVNVPRLVSKIADGVKAGKETTLKLALAKEMPPIYGDEGWLEKLFSHVIGNAAKYTPSGEIVVDAEKSGEMLKIGVHDTGIGIAPEKQGMIFESFSQADEGASRKYEGAGIGLAISKKVVELHGGRIWLHSAPGRGSHFYFTLPLKPIKLRAVELKN
jgi:signal transduction histidine kinase